MIPKIIHYCWFGNGKMSPKIKKCIKSWEKYCADFKIQRWDETNCDVFENQFVHDAYLNKKWAFVADYFRAKILYIYGGIYLDTDMLIHKSFDFALNNKAFVGLANPGIVSMGLLAFEPCSSIIKEHYMSYSKARFYNDDGTPNLTTNVSLFSNQLQKLGLGKEDKEYELEGIHIYPTEFFYPTDFDGLRHNFTNNTCVEHLHLGSWLTPKQKIYAKIRRLIYRSCIYNLYKRIFRKRRD